MRMPILASEMDSGICYLTDSTNSTTKIGILSDMDVSFSKMTHPFIKKYRKERAHLYFRKNSCHTFNIELSLVEMISAERVKLRYSCLRLGSMWERIFLGEAWKISPRT